MKHGFVKVAAVTPNIRVADVWYNCEEICSQMKMAEAEGAKIIVFPELCITDIPVEIYLPRIFFLRRREKQF